MKLHAVIAQILFAQLFAVLCSVAEPISPPILEIEPKFDCVDQIVSLARVDSSLDSDFFRTKDASYPFHIIEHEDGHLESTLGGQVSKEDATKIEHTAKCTSSHQGEHLMSFCDVNLLDGELSLELWGGLPAYTSFLTLRIDKDKNLTCKFSATYPMSVPGEKLSWTITKKSFKMTSDNFKAGNRLLGWISVEFEETSTIDGKVTNKSHKIEGYVKPIISNSATDSKPVSKGAPSP